jgi:hypothetical protein
MNLISICLFRCQKTHPGKVAHLSDHPADCSKLLIGFETGLIVLWNIKSKKAEARFVGPIEVFFFEFLTISPIIKLFFLIK